MHPRLPLEPRRTVTQGRMTGLLYRGAYGTHPLPSENSEAPTLHTAAAFPRSEPVDLSRVSAHSRTSRVVLVDHWPRPRRSRLILAAGAIITKCHMQRCDALSDTFVAQGVRLDPSLTLLRHGHRRGWCEEARTKREAPGGEHRNREQSPLLTRRWQAAVRA